MSDTKQEQPTGTAPTPVPVPEATPSVAADAKTTTTTAPAAGKKKRKRASQPRSKKTPLELKHAPLPDVFGMKKKIYATQAEVTKFNVPKKLRKVFRSIVSHKSVIEDPAALAEIEELYKKAVEYEAIVYMANCLLYYEEHHNIEFKKKDAQLIERSLQRTTRVAFDKMQEIFDNYICGIEARHRYYARFQRCAEPKKRVKRERPKPVKKVGKQLPYNLFIKESWKSRKTEFNTITKENGISSVMKKLSVEWKENPDLKTKYREMANKLNAEEHAAAAAAATATAAAATPVVESAV